MRVHIIVVVRPVYISLKTFTVMCLLCADTVTGLPFYQTLHNFIFTYLNLMQILDWLILAVNHPCHCFPLSGDRELIAGTAKD